ncbi:MAG TPA: hypothetical protein VF103_06245 [Polyangiaceae bacterium]
MRRFAPLVPLPLLLALAAWGSMRAADAGGALLGAALSAVASVVGAEQRPIDEDGELDTVVPTSTLVTDGALGDATIVDGVAAPKHAKAKSTGTAPASVRSVFISADKVLRLADGRAAPRGVRVPADGARPAGLKLQGVESLGIGLREGDVLTRALGQPATSSSAVIHAILVARSRHVKVLEGEFYRGRERWVLRVEQPYLEEGRREPSVP